MRQRMTVRRAIGIGLVLAWLGVNFLAAGMLPAVPRTTIRCSENFENIDLSSDGHTLAVSGRSSGTISLWDVGTGQRRWELPEAFENPCVIRLAPGGRFLVVVNLLRDPVGGLEYRGFDTNSGAELHVFCPGLGITFEMPDLDIMMMSFSPDGQTLASRRLPDEQTPASKPLIIRPLETVLWDLATGAEIATLPDSGQPIAFSPDGGTVCVGTTDGIEIRDAKTLSRRVTLENSAENRVIRWAPDGESLVSDDRILSSSGDFDQIWLWNATTGRLIASSKAERLLGFADGGRILATRTGRSRPQETANERIDRLAGLVPNARSATAVDGDPKLPDRVTLWDAATGQEIGGYDIPESLQGHGAKLSADGRYLLWSTSSWTARFSKRPWIMDAFKRLGLSEARVNVQQLATHQLVATVPGSAWEYCQNFSSGPQLFMTTSDDRKIVYVWDSPPRKPWGWFTIAVMMQLAVAAASVAARR